MDVIIKQVEFPKLGALNLGDAILFKENTNVFSKVPIGEPNGEEIIAMYLGTIKEFEIGTNVMQGTHGIILVCENIEFVSCTYSTYIGRPTINKRVNNYKNVMSQLFVLEHTLGLGYFQKNTSVLENFMIVGNMKFATKMVKETAETFKKTDINNEFKIIPYNEFAR